FIYTNNNTGVSTSAVNVTLTPPPDLTPDTVSGPTSASSGDRVDVNWRVLNVGPGDATGPWTDTLQLKEVGGTRTFTLGSFAFPDTLQSGKSYSLTKQVQLPVNVQGVFQYVLTTNVGNQIFENGATANNTFASPNTLLLSLPATPDLQVQSVNAPSQGQAAGTISLDFTIINHGTVPTQTPHWTDRVYLSFPPTINNGSPLLGSFPNGSALMSGESYQTTTGSLVIPDRFAGPGYLIIAADSGNAVNEYPNEGNNLFVVPINITPLPPADLVTHDVAAPDQAFDGTSIAVQYTASTRGLANTNVTHWNDPIWLTRDRKRPSTTKGDVLLATVSHDGKLGTDPSVLTPPNSYTQTVNVTLPSHISGQY